MSTTAGTDTGTGTGGLRISQTTGNVTLYSSNSDVLIWPLDEVGSNSTVRIGSNTMDVSGTMTSPYMNALELRLGMGDAITSLTSGSAITTATAGIAAAASNHTFMMATLTAGGSNLDYTSASSNSSWSVQFTAPTEFTSSLTASGPALVSGAFTASNTATFASNLLLTGTLNAYNSATFASNVTLNASLTASDVLVAGALTASNAATFSSNVLVAGPLTAFNAATFSSNVLVAGPLTASDAATFSSNVLVAGPLTASNAATFSSNVMVAGPLTASNAATFSSNVLVAGPLTASNSSTFSSNVLVTGPLTASNAATFSSNVLITGPLTASNSSTFSSNVLITGPLTASNAATFSSNVLITGPLTASNSSTFSSNVLVAGPLTASNVATFSSNVLVAGPLTACNAATFASTTRFGNDAVFSSNVTVAGTLNVTTLNNSYSNVVVYNSESVASNLTVEAGFLTVGSNANTTYPLHVQTTSADNNISIFSVGDVSALSDRRLKTDVQVIPDALCKLQAISGYTFGWVQNTTAPRTAGVIAQEVRSVLPEVVSTAPDGRLHVSYGNICALLIQATKELASRRTVLHLTTSTTDEVFELPLPPSAPAWSSALISATDGYSRCYASVRGGCVVGRCETPGSYVVWVDAR